MKRAKFNLLMFGFIMLTVMFSAINDNDLWFDTSFTVLNSERPLIDLLLDPQDVHPPLSYILVKNWVWFNGDSILSLRILHIFWAVIGLLGASQLGKLYKCQLEMVGVYATSNLVWVYALEIRMYIMALATLIWATVFYVRYTQGGKDYNFDKAVIIGSLAFLMHYYAILFLIVIHIHDFFREKRVYFNGISVFLMAYGISYLIVQKALIVKMWTKPVNASSYLSGIRYLWNIPANLHMADVWEWSAIPFIILILAVYVWMFIKEEKMQPYAFIAIGAPAFFIMLSALSGAYHHRYLVMFAFAPMLVVARYIRVSHMRYFNLGLFMVLGVGGSLLTQPNTELSSANQYLIDHARVNDIVLHENGFSYLPSMVYSSPLTHVVLSEYSREQLFSFGLVVYNESLIFYNMTAFNEFACGDGSVYYLKAELDYLPDSDLVLWLDGLNVTRQSRGDFC